MKKFWVTVNVKSASLPQSPVTSAVYADSIGEALDYAYDYLCSPYFGAIVQVFDKDMQPLFRTEFDF